MSCTWPVASWKELTQERLFRAFLAWHRQYIPHKNSSWLWDFWCLPFQKKKNYLVSICSGAVTDNNILPIPAEQWVTQVRTSLQSSEQMHRCLAYCPIDKLENEMIMVQVIVRICKLQNKLKASLNIGISVFIEWKGSVVDLNTTFPHPFHLYSLPLPFFLRKMFPSTVICTNWTIRRTPSTLDCLTNIK